MDITNFAPNDDSITQIRLLANYVNVIMCGMINVPCHRTIINDRIIEELHAPCLNFGHDIMLSIDLTTNKKLHELIKHM